MRVDAFEILASFMGFVMVFFPVWLLSVNIWRGNVQAVMRARFFGARLFLPRWAASCFHRLFSIFALYGIMVVLPFLIMSILILIWESAAGRISNFWEIFRIYWITISIIVILISIVMILFGRPVFLIPKFDRASPSGLQLRRDYMR